MALADTAASHKYLDEKAIPFCSPPKPTFGPNVKVANGNIITPIAQTTMNISTELSTAAQHAHIFDELATGSLVSIGQLCDDNCVALFSKYHLKILKNNKVIIQGKRNDNGLRDIPYLNQQKIYMNWNLQP